MLACPLEGVAKDAGIDGGPALRATVEKYLGDPAFSNLPRKYKTSISGCTHHCVNHEINDCAFVGVIGPDGTPGFDLWVGGGLSTNPMLAQKLGVWIPLDDVADVWEGVISIFRDYGYRRLRSRARLKFIVQDWGVEKFRQVLQDKYPGRELVSCDSPPVPARTGDHIGVTAQKDGRYFVGVAPTVGRVDGATLTRLAELAEEHGSRRVRTTPYQKLLVLDVEADRVESLVQALDGIGLSARPSNWRRSTMACTGIEFCKLAIVETKQRAADLISELERRFPDLDTPITVNVNGCPNACARTQVADIGLKGQLVLDADGRQVEGFQVHLGGGLGLDPRFGKKLRAHKVTSTGLDDYVTNVVTAYLDQREDGEAFATWVARAEDAALRGELGQRTLEPVS